MAVPPAEWANVPSHPLSRPGGGGTPDEPAAVRFGWCEAGLLARFEFTDSDVSTAASADNQLHYDLGDTAEWFLKPPGGTHYWEFYATPNGFRTAMAWEGPGPRESIAWEPLAGVRVAAEITSAGWTADLLVPGSLLGSRGDRWGCETSWTTLAARYNHGVGGSGASGTVQHSCFPPLPVVDFHRTDDYAELRLVAPDP